MKLRKNNRRFRHFSKIKNLIFPFKTINYHFKHINTYINNYIDTNSYINIINRPKLSFILPKYSSFKIYTGGPISNDLWQIFLTLLFVAYRPYNIRGIFVELFVAYRP